MEYSPVGTFGPTKPTEGWSNLYPDVKLPEGPSDPDNVFTLPKPFSHGRAVLGPHATMHISLGGFGVGTEQLQKNIDDGWKFYVYGVIHYNDIFSRSEPHVTKYCYSIGAFRTETGDIQPTNGLCEHWNCADDECRADHDAWVAELKEAFTKVGKEVPDIILFGPRALEPSGKEKSW